MVNEMEEFRQDMLRDQHEELMNAKRDCQMEDNFEFALEELNAGDTIQEFKELLYSLTSLGHDLTAQELLECL